MVDVLKIKKVIELHYADKNCRLSDSAEGYDDFEWFETEPKPTADEIETLYNNWVDNYHLIQHIETRKSLYPSTDELIVALWEKLVEQNGLTSEKILEIQSKRLEVKQSVPKLTEKPVKTGSIYGE
jgi:hypothetical protein